MAGGNKYKCGKCSQVLSDVKLSNSYDEKKDLMLCSDCYNFHYIPNSSDYIGYKTSQFTFNDHWDDSWKAGIIIYGYKVKKQNNIKIKLLGCEPSCVFRNERSAYKNLDITVNLGNETYDLNKDLFACSKCQGKYNQTKKKLWGRDEDMNFQQEIYLIKGVKEKGDPQLPPKTKQCEKCQKQQATVNLNIEGWKNWVVCQVCSKELENCSKCKKNKATNLIEEGKEKKQVCSGCIGSDKGKPIDIPKPNPGKDKPNMPDKNKPTDKDKDKPKSDEICQKCEVSCIVHQTKTSYRVKRKRYIKHKTDFTRESSVWFGTNCNCAREYREANQQTCPQCKKREFPHMKRGWLLDYEIKKAFCSPLCHVTYREMKWEEASRLTQIEMFPPELDIEVNPGSNVNWEQEGLRREVLFLRETTRELENRLNNQNNFTPEERLQSNYLRNLQQNTLQRAEDGYRSRYGNLNESDNENKGKGNNKGLIIGLSILGGAIVVGGIIFLVMRNRNKKQVK